MIMALCVVVSDIKFIVIKFWCYCASSIFKEMSRIQVPTYDGFNQYAMWPAKNQV